jgi:hypothetical protein
MEVFDAYYAQASDKIMNNKEWDNEGCRQFLPAMDAFYEMLEDEFDCAINNSKLK